MFRTLPLSVSLAGVDLSSDPQAVGVATGVRGLLEWLSAGQVRAVTLDAAAPGLRARELSRSARRDLAATLRRLELAPGGLDLWIPPSHFADPARQDRAISATVGALELASELRALAGAGAAVVTVELANETDAGVVRTLAAASERTGAALADTAWPVREGIAAPDAGGALAPSLDPASVLLAGADPVGEAGRLGGVLAGARLNDLSGSGRVEPGSSGGRLDVASYHGALAAGGYEGFVTLDLRHLREPTRAIENTQERWTRLPGS
ncbi:MAG: hypothetical protein EA378_01625 [Phycisphaerales bacterium]|nr:MAG: hypothetical protein EA378_01625 [Phycisphaerales bacterium]